MGRFTMTRACALSGMPEPVWTRDLEDGSHVRVRIGEGDSAKIHDWGSWARPWTPKADRWTAYA